MVERGGFAKARLVLWPDKVEIDRGIERTKLRRDNILKSDFLTKPQMMSSGFSSDVELRTTTR